jgi:hypothetical protein
MSKPNHNYIIDCVICATPFKLHFNIEKKPFREKEILKVA